ncbi:hypothetical protein [Burkholderia singularis]|uniref:hypothetical protein n=1 Tax=Burkholderia singularis TaxID=1503053 RepID=UPI001C47E32D|nr:hypothetical protein [Burkholderia singularis]
MDMHKPVPMITGPPPPGPSARANGRLNTHGGRSREHHVDSSIPKINLAIFDGIDPSFLNCDKSMAHRPHRFIIRPRA